eukprot:3482723-Prorocentrum_lima.AAC.1
MSKHARLLLFGSAQEPESSEQSATAPIVSQGLSGMPLTDPMAYIAKLHSDAEKHYRAIKES